MWNMCMIMCVLHQIQRQQAWDQQREEEEEIERQKEQERREREAAMAMKQSEAERKRELVSNISFWLLTYTCQLVVEDLHTYNNYACACT